MGFCGSCAKALLIIFNFIFWLSGAAILGVGIWMIADKNIGSYFEVLNIDTHDQYFKYASYILIAFGVFVFLVGFCGCCGAIRGSKCLLGMYIFFLFIIFAGELAAGIVMIIYKVEVEDKIDTLLKESVKNKYSSSTTITDAWNVVQIQLDCCGGLGPDDYMNSFFDNTTTSELPKSCCKLTNRDAAVENPNDAIPVDVVGCQNKTSTDYYWTEGCKNELLDWAKSHTAILIGVGIGIACIQIFGMVFAFILCRQVDKDEM